MKLYSLKRHRNIERQVHFGIGKSVRTACGLVLFSRRVMVSVFSDSDGSIITDDVSRVTCRRCLKIREVKLRKLIEIERLVPGIFDRDSLCGQEWLMEHGLAVNKHEIDSQRLELIGTQIVLTNNIPSKNRKEILHHLIKKER